MNWTNFAPTARIPISLLVGSAHSAGSKHAFTSIHALWDKFEVGETLGDRRWDDVSSAKPAVSLSGQWWFYSSHSMLYPIISKWDIYIDLWDLRYTRRLRSGTLHFFLGKSKNVAGTFYSDVCLLEGKLVWGWVIFRYLIKARDSSTNHGICPWSHLEYIGNDDAEYGFSLVFNRISMYVILY